jgi:uncharacterized protein (TIGR02001 family)
MNRKLSTIGLTVMLSAVSMPALAIDMSANIGYNSQYIYRGIPQKNSSAFGGFDLGTNGFYAGVWGADVGDGIEIDYFGGYGFDVGDFNFGVGGTIYTYTGNFDDTYREVNLSAGWKWLTFDAAIGTYDNFDGPTLDYQFYVLTAEYKGFYGKFGWFEDDFDGSYVEGGYGNTLTIQTLLGGESDTNLVLTLSKTFVF